MVRVGRPPYDRTTYVDGFWRKVDKCGGNGCWIWRGATSAGGYGKYGGTTGYNVGTSRAHRVAWILTRGEIPSGKEVDHLCHNPSCVNPDHMRLCEQGENKKNRKIGKDNTSGFKGVSRRDGKKKWWARIRVDWKEYSLGYFDTPEEAHQAYCEAAKRLHGEFSNSGTDGLT